MRIPEHLWRYATRAAIDSLAQRFDLPNSPQMQDWEWEVADHTRLDEFLTAYQSGDLTEDERFVLMETIIQSFEDLDEPVSQHPTWKRIQSLIEQNIATHIYTVCYWGGDEGEQGNDWRVSPVMRYLFAQYKGRFIP